MLLPLLPLFLAAAASLPAGRLVVEVRPPVAVSLVLTGRPGGTLELPLDGHGSQLLALPAGTYRLAIAAPGYWTAVRERVVVRESASTELPPIVLEPLPRIAGIVLDGKTREPIVGATVAGEDGGAMHTGPDGRFLLPLPTGAGASVEVRAHGYAPRAVAVAHVREDTTLPPILLAHGSGIRLTLERDDAGDTSAVLLRRRDAAPPDRRWHEVATRRGIGRTFTWFFDGLDAGAYTLAVRGEGPLQRSSVVVNVVDEAVADVHLVVHDAMLRGTVTWGTSPVANAALTFSLPSLPDSGVLTADNHGEFRAVAWQGGFWSVRVHVAGEPEPFLALRRLGDGDASWDIAIPRRELTGRVVDAVSGAGVAGARVTDNLAAVITSGDGSFRFGMAAAGVHLLGVEAAGYLDRAPLRVDLREDDTHCDVSLSLQRGVPAPLHVTDAAGQPIAGAEIYDWVGDLGVERRDPYVTDAFGDVAVPVEAGGRKALYAVTRSGAFAFALADAAHADKPIDLVVDAPTASLTIEAPPNVQVLVRVNGRVLPPSIWDRIGWMEGVSTSAAAVGRITLPRLPPGFYEIWTYGGAGDLRALLAAIQSGAVPARVTLQPGPNSVRAPG
jgi:hypothetical protein